MCWLRNKKNSFLVRTLLWGPEKMDGGGVKNLFTIICGDLLSNSLSIAMCTCSNNFVLLNYF